MIAFCFASSSVSRSDHQGFHRSRVSLRNSDIACLYWSPEFESEPPRPRGLAGAPARAAPSLLLARAGRRCLGDVI
jgi:hypothetical protein